MDAIQKLPRFLDFYCTSTAFFSEKKKREKNVIT